MSNPANYPFLFVELRSTYYDSLYKQTGYKLQLVHILIVYSHKIYYYDNNYQNNYNSFYRFFK